jgi:DNA polymerase zeta
MEEINAPGVSLEIKLVQIDYYKARKFQRREPGVDGLRAKNYVNSPVVRVFGVTPGGQAMCIHVHGALPYFYVEFKDEDLRDVVGSYMRENGDVGCRTPQEQAGVYVMLFQKALNVALHEQRVASYESYAAEDNVTGQSGVKIDRFVSDVQLVRGTPFYGFHRQECVWMKVYMYDPAYVKKAANVLMSGAIFGKTFQPHESHIPFLLQFKIDYNLYGMGWIKLKNVTFRAPVPRAIDEHMPQLDQNREDRPVIWSTATVGCITTAARATTCELEGDVLASDILNVCDKIRVDINRAPVELQVVDSLGPMWAEERRRQGKSDVRPTPPDIERNIEQIDPDTVELWRDKFFDAEQNRLFHEESSDEDLPSTLGTCPSANDAPSGAHEAVDREEISEEFMKSLVDIELIRSSQLQQDHFDDTERILTVLEEWEQTQRENGYMCSQQEEGVDDQLALLAKVFESSFKDPLNTNNKDPMKVLEMFMNSQDVSSRALAGRHAQSFLSQGAREAENECRDIIEASQAFEDEMRGRKR